MGRGHVRRQNSHLWLRILLLVTCVAIGSVGLYRYVYIDHFSMAARAVRSIPLGASTEELGLDPVPLLPAIGTMADSSLSVSRFLAKDARRRLGGSGVSDLRSGGMRNLALGYTDGSRATLIFRARDETRTRRRWIIPPWYSEGIDGWRESEPSSPPYVGDPYLRPALNRWKPPKYTPPKFTIPKYKLPTPRTYTPGVRRSVTETYSVTAWRYETSRIGLWFEPPDEGGLPDWP